MICCRRTRAANTEIIQATIFCTVFLFGGGDAGYASTLLQSMNTPSVMSARVYVAGVLPGWWLRLALRVAKSRGPCLSVSPDRFRPAASRAYTPSSRLTNYCLRHVFRELQARMMDQLTEMRVFVRAIERGTFAAAAGDQGLTPSAVSKLIRRLEARLGVRLINRTTRKLSLTAEGETYFHSGRRLIEAVDGLEDEVAASADHPRGLLRINTEIWWGVQHLAPALIDFQQRYPDVRVSLSLTDRLVDLHAEQIDVAIRLGPLSNSNLMSRN